MRTIRRRILWITGIIILAIGMNVFLFALTPKEGKNGFERQFFSTKPIVLQQYEFNGKIIEISGSQDNKVLLRSETPGIFYTIDLTTKELDTLSLDLTEPFLEYGYLSSYTPVGLSVLSFVRPTLNKYRLDGELKAQTRLQTSTISNGIVISPNLVIVRGFDETGQNKLLRKVHTPSGEIQKESYVFGKGNDGGLLTDGLLHYDTITHSIVYTYHYGNGFLRLDTNLNVLQRHRTIDTLTVFQAKPVRSGHSITHAAPPGFVTLYSCVDQGKLYTNSVLIGDNETAEVFDQNSVIDIYTLNNGQYLGSFYIPRYKGRRVSRFQVRGNILIALYDRTVHVFRIPELSI